MSPLEPYPNKTNPEPDRPFSGGRAEPAQTLEREKTTRPPDAWIYTASAPGLTGRIYQQCGAEIGAIVDEKNEKYGDSFQKSGDVMRIYYPHGISPEQMDDALAMVRVIDKQFRISTDKDAFGESPWMDIAGYAMLMAHRDALRRQRQACVRENLKRQI